MTQNYVLGLYALRQVVNINVLLLAQSALQVYTEMSVQRCL